MAILGVCLSAAAQAAKQQPKAKPNVAAPAQPQPPSDEELMKKTAQATIDWDRSTTKGAKVDVLLIKKDQADGKPVMQCTGMAHLGGATLDNEENYLIKKLFTGGLGMVCVSNQARI